MGEPADILHEDDLEEERQDAQGEDVDPLQFMDAAARSQPLKVDRILLAGLERTRPSVVENEFHVLEAAETIDGIRDALDAVEEALLGLDIFNDVDISIVPSRSGRKGTCDVVLHVHEKPRVHVTAGTYFQSNEASAEVQATLRNAVGFAEKIQFAVERGTKGSNEYSVGIRKPHVGGEPLTGDVRVMQTFRNQPAASFTERNRGAAFTVSSDDMAHSLTYELGWRTVTDPSRRASKAVQQQLGHALKSGAQYTFRHSVWATDRLRDGGYALKSTSEVAGLAGGNAVLRFAKQRLQGVMTVPLPDTTAYLSLGADLGVMLPWGPGWRQRQTPIGDRFFLGGPGSLRGFCANSAGPSELRRPLPRGAPPEADGDEAAQRRDYIGGDLHAAVSAALHFDLPWEGLSKVGIHGHVFANAGNSALLRGNGHDVRQSLQQFFQDFRLTVGVGLVWPIARMGNLEVNICRIVRAQGTDRAKHGIQLGFAPLVM